MPTPWQLSLQQASFRGVPFGVRTAGTHAGRRVALHQYPFRDTPYAEDLGRDARRMVFSGFVVGDDAGTQADALLTACEQKGAGELVHPVYGRKQMQVLSADTEERWDNGRVIEFRFIFVEPGEVIYPTAAADTQAATQQTAADSRSAIGQDFRGSANTADATKDAVPIPVDGGFNTARSGIGPTEIPLGEP